MSIYAHSEITWRCLVGLSALAFTFSCILAVFESFFFGITFGDQHHRSALLSPRVCRLGAGVWCGGLGVVCSAFVLAMLCKRKDRFAGGCNAWSCVTACTLMSAGDSALLVVEWLCWFGEEASGVEERSPLPLFLSGAAGIHVVSSISSIILFGILWKSESLESKEAQCKKKELVSCAADQGHMIIIPNILQSQPSFVSVQLTP